MKIFKMTDKYMNDYLHSRNLFFNRKNMINDKKIKQVDHFLWWFESKRRMNILEIDKKSKIFFWDQIIKFKKKRYIIGGWHANVKSINMYYVIYLCKKQIQYHKKKNNYPWVALVKKKNKSVLNLTKYLGYKIVKKNDNFYKEISDIFGVNSRFFNFLILR